MILDVVQIDLCVVLSAIDSTRFKNFTGTQRGHKAEIGFLLEKPNINVAIGMPQQKGFVSWVGTHRLTRKKKNWWDSKTWMWFMET